MGGARGRRRGTVQGADARGGAVQVATWLRVLPRPPDHPPPLSWRSFLWKQITRPSSPAASAGLRIPRFARCLGTPASFGAPSTRPDLSPNTGWAPGLSWAREEEAATLLAGQRTKWKPPRERAVSSSGRELELIAKFLVREF